MLALSAHIVGLRGRKMYVVQSVFRAGANLQLPFLLPGHEDYEKGCRNVITSSSNNITISIIPVPLSLDISAQPRTVGSLEGRRLRDVTRGKLALRGSVAGFRDYSLGFTFKLSEWSETSRCRLNLYTNITLLVSPCVLDLRRVKACGPVSDKLLRKQQG